ncbi:MAG TPA: FAD-binding oxidoreductase [Anaerolineaceae bacterium]|nr:FAD-binding oxidoreductase [Anaerolineaceae bacterium]
MKRWNGWGDVTKIYPLPQSGARYLAGEVGTGQPTPDARIEEVIACVPPSRLAAHPLVQTEAEERLRHARGQSLPDWIALRSGRIPAFPDGVAYPTCDEDVRSLLQYASSTGTGLIPYGGGSSVVGHINALPGQTPVLTVDMSRMNALLDLDRSSLIASFGAGVRGPDLEAALKPYGFILGHYPQSYEYSTLGGWIAARSSGQQSYRYGRIEDLFAGGHLETPQGGLELPVVPASAAGPDIKQVILGSEGRFGILTRAAVRIRPLPQSEIFLAAFFPDWESGAEAVRAIVQADIQVSMLRLSNAQETRATLALSGREQLVDLADRGLPIFGYGPDRCLLYYGLTGSWTQVRFARRQTDALIRSHRGVLIPFVIGELWRKTRFTTPYLRNTLWETGYALDTLETALPWSEVLPTALEVQDALSRGFEDQGERVLAFSHLSHIYRMGASFYVTYIFRRAPDPDETFRRWQVLKQAASQIILHAGGTISHQHGVGVDHAPYLPVEKGVLGMEMLESLRWSIDPEGILNPGKLIEAEDGD